MGSYVCIGLGLLAFIAIAALLGVIAYTRISSLLRRVEALEHRLTTMSGTTVASHDQVASPPPPPPIPAHRTPVARPTTAPVIPAVPVTEPSPPVAHVEPPPSPAAAPGEIAPARAEARIPATPRFELERWLGVRGAAVLGGVFLAIAGFLFVQYSIERGLVTPQTRVIIGAIVGVACLVAAVPLRKRGYEIVASSITGAGSVLLYAATWAAHQLYGMIDLPIAAGALIAVTATCGWLASRYRSQVIAVLGLAGGFATPYLLSTGQDRPIGLFGYVLLLDFAFLSLARKRQWPSLALIALAGTFVVQALWIFLHMDRSSYSIGLVVLGIFALLFVGLGALLVPAERRRWIVARAGALLLPFVFALCFAQESDLGESFWPLAALAALLTVGACWTARQQDASWLPFGSACAFVALALTWTVAKEFDWKPSQAWELALSSLALALIHHANAELTARRAAQAHDVFWAARGSATALALGLGAVLVYGASRPIEFEPWPWLAGAVPLALLVARQRALGAPLSAAIVAALECGFVFFAWSAAHARSSEFPGQSAWLGAILCGGGLMLLAAFLQRSKSHGVAAWIVAAFLLPAMISSWPPAHVRAENTAVFFGVMLAIGVQLALAATIARSSAIYVVAVASTCIMSFFGDRTAAQIAASASFHAVFWIVVAGAVILALWPVAEPRVWKGRATVWRAAVLTLGAWAYAIHDLFVARWTNAPVFILPLALEVVAIAGAARLHAMRENEDPAQRVGRIWFAAAAIFFAALILPLQVGRETAAITLSLFALGLSMLSNGIEHRVIAWSSVTATLIATFALVFVRPWSSFEHSTTRVANILAYLYLLPAFAAAGSAAFLRKRGESVVIPATISGLCAVLLAFAWINLEISNAFAEGSTFVWHFQRQPARDLTVSIAWAVYVLSLLLLGVSKRRSGLRWSSLILLLMTIGKVFLFDLAHLEGLFRAASMLGLALSLLIVSLLYQRFVFRRATAAA